VAHDVTNVGIDRSQLSSMAKQACEAMGTAELTVVADRGCFKSEEILGCHEAGITAIRLKSAISNAIAEGRFGRADFIYDPGKNEYRCPAGQSLIWRFAAIEHGMKLSRYWSSHCQSCSIKALCTPSPQRRATRWVHEEVLEVMQTRLDRAPEMMRIRRQTAEHLFGTIKLWVETAHFLTRTLARVAPR
jgi:transposase